MKKTAKTQNVENSTFQILTNNDQTLLKGGTQGSGASNGGGNGNNNGSRPTNRGGVN